MDWHGNPDSEILSETLQGHQYYSGSDSSGVYLQYIEMRIKDNGIEETSI
jgi:hypothetical protein